MRCAAPPLSQHRLSRLHRWTLLWLTWFAAFLDAAEAFAPLTQPARALAQTWLDAIERAITSIILIRAAPRVRAFPARRFTAPTRSAGVMRAIRGARLRRALASRADLRERVAALRALDIDAHVAALSRRLPRGLTRRRAIRAQRGPVAPLRRRPHAHTSADTS